jgi:hypothetical protein
MRALIVCLLALQPPAHDDRPQERADNVVLVTIDGLRWQEVFHGADNALMDAKKGGVRDLLATRRRFWRGEAGARREVLLPFLWGTVAPQGQVFGDPEQRAAARVTNTHWFSYPGYNELLAGHADPRIDSNANRPNPNVTVLDFLNQRDPFRGRVAVFSGWAVHEGIVNPERSGAFVHAGWKAPREGDADRVAVLSALYASLPRQWPDFAYDALTFQTALLHLRERQPRVLYLALGETDEWAHARRYDLYLDMAQRADEMVAELWRTLQGMPQYAGRTALVITVDHGRGRTPEDWTDHKKEVPGADEVWIAAMGPGIAARGVRVEVEVTLAQVAATLAALLGEDYAAFEPRAAAPLPGLGGH